MVADGPDKGSPHDRARIVRRYLSALDARKPGRTSARTGDTIANRMHQIDTLLMSADPVQRLLLTQERIDLHAEQLRLTTPSGDFDQLEKAFTRVAKAWGDRHDITYSAWRQVGVDAEVLSRANILPAAKPVRPQPAGRHADKPAKADVAAERANAEAPAEPAAAKETPAATADGKDLESAVPLTRSAAKTEPAPKKPAAKKPAAAKKKAPSAAKTDDGATDGAAPGAKKDAPRGKAVAPAEPEQQRLPAEAHLLS